MKLIKNASLRMKLIVITVGLVIATSAVVLVISTQSLERSITKEKKEKTTELAEVGLSVLKHYHALEQEGTLTREEAQNKAKETIRAVRFGKQLQDYFWIQDFHPRIVMHPFKPKLEGQDVSHVTDPDGLSLFVEFVKQVRREGKGHVPYKWQYYDDANRIEPKLSFVAEFKPWDWIIGTGVYIDSIDRDVGMQTKVILMISMIVVAISMLVAFFFSSRISGVLTRIVHGLSGGAEQVASASGQVASSSQSLAEGSSEQASSLEETSSSLEEMAAQTRQNADNAEQADNAVKETARVVAEGVSSMERMDAAINEIKESANETSKIIKTIDDIAFQTNLLALNAAVEAARAGEAGKGFAVVAEEVRNLAQRSAEAAQNTSQLIEKSQENANNGVSVAEEVAGQLKSIKDSAEKVNSLIGEIAAASKEQAQGIDQVNTAVSEMDKVVQQNAADSEESASAAEELSSQASEMERLVLELKSLTDGRRRAELTGGQVQVRARGRAEQALPNRSAQKYSQGEYGQKEGKRSLGQFRQRDKQSAARGHAANMESGREKRPDQVIPLDDDEFKDF